SRGGQPCVERGRSSNHNVIERRGSPTVRVLSPLVSLTLCANGYTKSRTPARFRLTASSGRVGDAPATFGQCRPSGTHGLTGLRLDTTGSKIITRPKIMRS